MPPTSKDCAVLVLARAPRPGLAKTRLAPLLGAEGAAALHARLLKRVMGIVQRLAPKTFELHGDPADDAFLGYCAARYGAVLIAQAKGDLGARMGFALHTALLTHRAAVLIGTDCPALSSQHLRQAARALGKNDAVFVPTEDGGYALVGLARYDAVLFEDIAWGTDRVMAGTRAKLQHIGWRWSELETLWDVDRPADYVRLLASGLLPA